MDNDKLKDIKTRITQLKIDKTPNSNLQQEISPFTIAIDLVSGTIVGFVIGLLTDKFFHSKPLFIIIFTIIGIIAGFNIVRQRLISKK
ncbi:MAG TPA: AtpZ/AtpI family protein [Rickettsia endosymbiont of Degeeriella rufa]|nr:AtpZ/AtpI family protein [Rickettsia endosymbiont of Columbicola hoogstraali]HJD62905.1 AtpZ/AtpI family protein [Rickettsia endosymbiont of Degeeriella rufa]